MELATGTFRVCKAPVSNIQNLKHVVMSADKIDFLKNRLVPLLSKIPTDKSPAWGKMTMQQMVEHLSETFRIASGKTIHQLIVTPQEHLPKMQAFLMSEKPFRENTANPLLPQDPAPVTNMSIEDALKELEEEIQHFFAVFEANENLTTRNPVFGDLNFKMNVHLLYKHVTHHLKQFGVQEEQLPEPASPGTKKEDQNG